MRNKGEKVTVKYRTKRNFCRCCDRELDDVEVSGVREFDFYLSDLKEYGDWGLYDERELNEVIDEYIYETVSFYSVNHGDVVEFEKGSKEKLMKLIKENWEIG